MPNARARTGRSRSAFTLVEAVIVVAVAAVLIAIGMQRYEAVSPRAKVARVKSDMESLAQAIEAYIVDYDQPPIAPRNRPWDQSPPWVWRRVTNPIDLFTPLTTPVAYIPSVALVNPFADHSNGPGLSPIYPCDFVFINFTTGVNALNSHTWCGQPMTDEDFVLGKIALRSVPVQYCFNGDTSRKFPATWVLVAVGPSGNSAEEVDTTTGFVVNPWWVWGTDPAFECYTQTAKTRFYDASNGTRSVGHLWRFSSGGMK